VIWVQPKKLILPRRTLRSQGGFILPSGLGMGGPKDAGPADPLFANVGSLLHFDGANNSTTFTDVKGNTWTANGNARLGNGSFVFGTAAYFGDGTNDWISATNAQLALGSGDFCIEFWFYMAGDTVVGGADTCILDWRTTEPDASNMLISMRGGATANPFRFSVYINGSNNLIGGIVPLTTWTAYAIERVGSTIKVAVNGTFGSGITSSANFTGTTLNIGGRFAGLPDRRSVNGRIDEFRLTVGANRYNHTNYTPASAAFPNFGP
jgi:hypothetical protein